MEGAEGGQAREGRRTERGEEASGDPLNSLMEIFFAHGI